MCVATDVAWLVCPCVCLSLCLCVLVVAVCHAGMAEPIEMPFGMWTYGDQRAQIPSWDGVFLRVAPRHTGTYVDIPGGRYTQWLTRAQHAAIQPSHHRYCGHLLLLHLALGIGKQNVLWWRPSVCVCICLCVTVCVCLSLTAFPHYCMDPDVTLESGSRCPLVVHCWVDLQLVHGYSCYGSIHSY